MKILIIYLFIFINNKFKLLLKNGFLYFKHYIIVIISLWIVVFILIILVSNFFLLKIEMITLYYYIFSSINYYIH
jgi:hypothetical protein